MNSKINVKENKHVNHLSSEHPNSNVDTEFFSTSNFKELTQIKVLSNTDEELVFEIKNIDAPLANALRRILISEIPTMAIENCTFYQNTSIIPDEVLAHRLGLIPIFADANIFSFKNENEEFSEFNNLCFKLHVVCDKEPIDVLSNQIKWIPQGNQKSRIDIAKPVHDDILIAKLRPGQEIEVEMIAVKGLGKDHTKWSPVCTAYYRLTPDVKIKTTVKGDKANKIKELCPMGVFDIEDSGKLFVSNEKKCTMCRECIRHDDYKDDIELGKLKNSFECNFLIKSILSQLEFTQLISYF